MVSLGVLGKDIGPVCAGATRYRHKPREPTWVWEGEQKTLEVLRKPYLSHANSSTSRLIIMGVGGRKSYHGHLAKALGSLCGGFSGNGALPGTRSLGVLSSAHCP